MFQQKETKRGKELLTWFRMALLVTALGLVVLAIEQPRLAASPNGQRATADAISHQTVAVHGGATADVSMKALESESPTPYFPAQFPPPKGEPEPQPPTF